MDCAADCNYFGVFAASFAAGAAALYFYLRKSGRLPSGKGAKGTSGGGGGGAVEK